MLHSPLQALIWKNWKLTRRSLLLQQVSVISISWLVLTYFFTELPAADRLGTHSVVSHGIVLSSLLFLLLATSNIYKKDRSSRFVTGFPFRQEFVLPVSAYLLFTASILYFSVLFLIAYAFPLVVLNLLIGTAGPQPAIAILVVYVLLLTLSLGWWTSNKTAHTLGWCVFIIIGYQDWIYPELVLSTESLTAKAASLAEYLAPSIVVAGFILVTFLGVKKQRHGDNLFGFGSNNEMLISEYGLRKIKFGSVQPCPVDSPIRAEFWKERQVHSKFMAMSLGVSCSLVSLIFIRFIHLYNGQTPVVGLDTVIALTFGIYWLAFMALHINSFGMSTSNGVPRVGVFEKTTGLGSAQLFLIKFLHKYLNLLIAAAALITSTWLFGPLFIDNFAELRSAVLSEIAEYLARPVTTLAFDVVRVLIYVAIVSIGFSLFLAWLMLKPRAVSWGLIAMLSYIFILTLLTRQFTAGADEFDTVSRAIPIKHLWLFIVGVPVLTAYVYRSIMRDMTLTVRQLLGLVSACALIWIFRTFLIVDEGFFASDLEIELLIANVLVGLIPLLAIGGALFTMNKIRHG